MYERHEKQEKENIAAFEKIKEQETKDTVSEGEFRKFLVDEIPKLTAGIQKIANWIPKIANWIPNDGGGSATSR